MPYLEIEKDNEEEEERKEVEVPNLVGMTKNEAQKTLEEVGLSIELRKKDENADSENTTENQANIITEQLPKPGIKIKEGTSVIAYY